MMILVLLASKHHQIPLTLLYPATFILSSCIFFLLFRLLDIAERLPFLQELVRLCDIILKFGSA